MALVKKPTMSNQMLSDSKQITPEQKAFISGSKEAGQPTSNGTTKSHPVMLRVDIDMLSRIDKAAKRIGLKRAAFFVSAAAEKMEKLERD